MSLTMPPTDGSNPAGQVVLPAGVTVSPGRETSQINAAGQVVQGMIYPIALANGTTSSVFIPDNLSGNVPQIQALFEGKVAALTAIPIG